MVKVTSRRIFGAIFIVCVLGGRWLSCAPDFHDTWWAEMHLAATRENLAAVAEILARYRQVHGGYPDMNQGLNVIDTFDSRFPSRIREQWHLRSFLREVYNRYDSALQYVRWRLQDFHAINGRYPQNDRELYRVGIAYTYGEATAGAGDPQAMTRVDMGVSAQGVFPITEAGILDPWGVPYVYENRAGLTAGLEFSPADDRFNGNYAVKVDDGVYVYSVGAWVMDGNDFRNKVKSYSVWGIVLLAIIGALFLYVRNERETTYTWKVSTAWLVGLTLALVLVIDFLVFSIYYRGLRVSYTYFYPEKWMYEEYDAMIDQYGAAGALAGETAVRFKAAAASLREKE
jgi:hypothetical protein